MTNPMTEKINIIYGIIITILSTVFGEHWILFVGYLGLNICDFVTGCMKARMTGKSSSKKGEIGVLKKFGYWIMIMVAFGMSVIFIEIGRTIHVDLKITTLLGWFVLATLIVNEFRSIIENFVEAGFNVPKILVKGLEVANKAVDMASEKASSNGDS